MLKNFEQLPIKQKKIVRGGVFFCHTQYTGNVVWNL